MKNKVIKAESKALISGKRGKALLIVLFGILFCAVMTAIIFGAIFISRVFKDFGVGVTIASAAVLIFLSLITLCVYSSAAIGEKAWYGGLTGNKRNCARRLFFWFRPKNAFRALWFNVLLFLIKTMWAIVFFLPSIIFLWSVYYLSASGGLELYLFISLAVGGVLLAVSGLVFYLIATERYFIAGYLFSSDPRLSAMTAIRQSKNLLDGHIFEIVRFKLSFIPWILSCIFIAPAFYVIPYYKESCCMVAKKITL